MVKGPKALLSHAIANALAENFEVDPEAIESNLITDTKIVLRNARLRDKKVHSNETVATVTGSVDEVSFRWKWNVSSDSSKKKDVTEAGWVKDAVLTIKGLRFKAQLAYHTDGSSETGAQTTDMAEEKSTSKMEAESTKKENEGRIKAYMARQVQNIIDSLTLDVVDCEFIVEMPASDMDKRTTSIIVGGKTVEIRREASSDQNLEQRLTIASFFASVLISAEEATCDSWKHEPPRDSFKQLTYLLLEPFSYSATVTRLLGRRFDGIGTGINLIGRPVATSVESLLDTGTDNGIVLHAGAVQIQALTRLASMVLAPTDDNDAKPPAAEEEHNVRLDIRVEDTKHDEQFDDQMVDTTPSVFEIPVSAVSLVIMEDTTIVVSNVNVTYKADGTLLNVEAQRFDLGSKSESGEAGAKCSISGIRGRMRPIMVLEMDVINRLYVPGVIDLTKELCNPSIAFQGDTLSIDLSSVEAIVPYNKEAKQKDATGLSNNTAQIATSDKIADSTIQDSQKDSPAVSKHVTFLEHDKDTSSSTTNMMAPFPICISLQDLKLKQASDNSLTFLQDLVIKLKPDRTDVVGTAVLVHLGKFKNELLQLRNASVTALLPRDEPDVTHDFKLDAESLHVHAGHSSEEWSVKFEPPSAAVEKTHKSKKGPQKMPFAQVASLNIRIAYKGTGVALKETVVVVQPFVGEAETTLNDLLLYYTRACLSRVPGFISNAQVLGVNVVDTTAAVYGGVAAIAAIDAAKGLVAVGKESRNVTSDDCWKPGDFIRGALHMPGAITKAGAQKRRGEESESTKGGNVAADFAVGACSTTGEYVGENKSRLGAAGATGMGVICGTMLGGPIGGIVGGVIAGAAAGKAIETIEESVNDRASEKIKGDLAEVRRMK